MLSQNDFEFRDWLEIMRPTNVCEYRDFTDARLSSADLFGADFENTSLAGSNLSKADLSLCPMEKRTLSRNFESAIPGKINLSETWLMGANFKGVNIN